MININKTIITLLLLSTFVLAGCATRQPIFTNRVVSTVGVDWDYINNNFELVDENAEVVLNRHFLVYLPLSGYYSFNDETISNELLYKYQGDLITNLRIDKKFLFLLYYNRYYVVANGKVWKRKKEA
ncbi:MAG: hypothetical protein OEX07_02010 [Gammaproteobacteria bacterium]|nr:hypothetical protein [Gammaproteobacteria bacterium]